MEKNVVATKERVQVVIIIIIIYVQSFFRAQGGH